MKDEYIIINKTAIQKRIEECEEVILELFDRNLTDWEEAKNKVLLKKNKTELNLLREILFQSTPLIPEIDKAYEAGILDKKKLSLTFDNPKGRYLNSLKLDI
jgi:hypothetical protein